MGNVRPDGMLQIRWAWGTLALGVLCILMGAFQKVDSYTSIDDLATKWSYFYLGGMFLTMSFFLALAGSLIKAIYYIPCSVEDCSVDDGE